MRPTRWVSMIGRFDLTARSLVFKGGLIPGDEGQQRVEVGNFVCDHVFSGGTIRAKVTFRTLETRAAAGLILHFRPQNGAFVVAQLGGPSLCSLRTWGSQEWNLHAAHGPVDQLQPGRAYDLQVRVAGSRVSIKLDGILIVDTNLPFSLPVGQPGIWAIGPSEIEFADYEIDAERPRLFVVMQFTDPFNELYRDVIKPVAEGIGFDVVRADETYGPGMIIADIERQIVDAKAIVADITPNNPNVYWEVGYAHAIRKPTILIAQRGTSLPFDVSPFRTLFYDDTIAGKSKIEDGLRKHIAAIQGEWVTS